MATFREMGVVIREPEVENVRPTQVPSDDYYMDSVIDDIENPEDDSNMIDMTDVEVRLEEANYFKALLQNSLFEEPLSPIAKRVEKRVRSFIQQELKVLLGMEAVSQIAKTVEIVKSPFTSDEEKVLKALANKAMERFAAKTEPSVVPAVVPSSSQNTATTQVNNKQLTVKRALAPEKPKQQRGRKKIVEKEVTVNGEVVKVKMDVTGQTRPSPGTPGYYPPMTPEQMSMRAEQEALQNVPQDGMLGLAYQLANRDLIKEKK